MLSQRRCPCCIGTEPEYRQHISRKAQKTTKVQKTMHQYVSEAHSDESEGKPYAYLGEGEIWANGDASNGGKIRLIAAYKEEAKSDPESTKCTYRVSPIKSKNEIQDGDLIIETSDHKYLKVLGPDDLSDGDDFYVLIDPGKKSKRRARSSSTSSSSSSSSEEEVYVAKRFLSPGAAQIPRRFTCHKRLSNLPNRRTKYSGRPCRHQLHDRSCELAKPSQSTLLQK
ncbi:hypothetical protein TSMEX_011714 [Taenia solium]|eukprot:TsM_001214800 transcript=TsM_001214800 gene=TsM_001214800